MDDKREKSLLVAIGLNVLLPGAGYWYLGEIVLGVAALVLMVLVMGVAALVEVLDRDEGVWLLPWLGLNVAMAIDMWILFRKKRAATRAPE